MFLRASILVVLAVMTALPAAAEIALSPLRQVITLEAPAATYRLSNPSRRIIEGRVSWIDLSATATGYAAASADTREHLSAAPFLTVWPAFFKLDPGESLTITVALRDGAAIPEGERRSHLLIETGAPRTPLRNAGGLELDIGLGISTPVILRDGAGEARARIAKTRLLRGSDGLLELSTTLEPEGQFSAYGRLVVTLAPEGGRRHELARLDNAALWRDAPERRFDVPLAAEFLPPGVLELRYEGAEEFEGRLFSSRAFAVAPPE